MIPLNHLQAKYEAWRAENPKIMELYMKFALQACLAQRRFSISLLTERVRWETVIKKKSAYKINNNFRSYIARDLIREYPAISYLIETRRVMGEA